MQTFTIILLVYLGLVINFFRWSSPRTDSRGLTWGFTLIVGPILILIGCTPFKDKVTLLETPKYLEYNTFKSETKTTNYLLWRADDNSAANIEWIGDIEAEKTKKFYQVIGIAYWGFETTKPKIERW